MSHELRTPLHAIVGYADVQIQGILGEPLPKQRENLNRILVNATHLTALIDDVLDIVKLDAGRLDIVLEPFTIRDWLRELVQQAAGLAEQKGLTFEVVLDEQLPDMISGDPRHLMQIAINLVANAIKFTHKGSVRVDVKVRNQDNWALIVRDAGIGIPTEALDHIFERFWQVDSSSKREYGGTGLGLAIVRELATLMDGEIQVDSQVGEGSTFTVILPLRKL
ncbi:hypothetical protein KFU94_01170 [Chloroflexi bacterium TSY]|nr:hypothetical protein [Chloroflexi bacterium TSY]